VAFSLPNIRRVFDRFAVAGLSRNAVFGVGQAVIVTVCLFLAYRLVIQHAGLERFGVWSLLLAGASIARVGDVSGAGALARFVAASPPDNAAQRADLVHTVMLTSLALNAVLGLALWFAAPFALPLFIPVAYLTDAERLIPYVIASLVLGGLAVAATAGLDGAQRADQRAAVVVFASIAFVVACAVLVPGLGVVGFGIAQLVQQVTLLIVGVAVLQQHIPGLTWLPRRWRRDLFVKTTGYALKLNGISLLGLMFEPMAKFAFNSAGGPALVALYEFSSRLVIQVRGLVVAALTPLVPAFAARPDATDARFRQILERAMRAACVAALGTAVAALVGAPLMSLFVLGRLSPELLLMNAALTAGWAINVLALPFYFAAQGQGMLRWNFVGHAAAAGSVLLGVFFLIPPFGSVGLVGAIVFGILANTCAGLLGNATMFRLTGIVLRLRWWIFATVLAIAVLCRAARYIFAVVDGP
jgi:O-antigen/teichoic acid export membrane protein